MKKNKGITLIALVITIIVMLILVGVSVSILVESDLIGATEKTGDKYKSAYEEEQSMGQVIIGNKTYASINEYMNNNPIKNEDSENTDIPTEPKIGDYVNYEPTPDTYEVTAEQSGHSEVQNFTTQTGENSLKWRIMTLGDVEAEHGPFDEEEEEYSSTPETGKIVLVADRVTTDKLKLHNSSGFENGVTHIEGICSTLYDNATIGATARSFNPWEEVYDKIGWTAFRRDSLVVPDYWWSVDSYDVFWLPLSAINWESTVSDEREIMTSERRMSNLYGASSAEYSLLPVVVLPDVDLVYDEEGSTATEIHWNIE